MREIIIKNLKIHSVIFIALILFMVSFIFVSSLFNSIHPDAYRDGVMSIVYVYAVIIIILIPIEIVRAKADSEKLASSPFIKWHFQNGLISHIALMFTLITVINSIMMVTGIDIPKIGLFAYTHLLIRLGIVSVAGILWMLSSLILSRKEENPKTSWKPTLNNLSQKFISHPIVYSFNSFTLTVLIFILFVHFLSLFTTITGGFYLYISLIIYYLICLIFHIAYSKLKG